MKTKTQSVLFTSTALLATSLTFLSGCSSQQYAYDPQDPLQGMNRATFSFNKKVDTYAIKPVAKGYKAVTPQVVRDRVTNVFSNLGELPTMANDALQLNAPRTANSLTRFLVNSTFGLLGMFDVATSMGLEKHYNDFGITLAHWGVTTAPYLVLPIIGPSTIRDSIALYPDFAYFSAWPYMDDIMTSNVRNGLFVLDLVNLRASLLTVDDVAKEASIDEYVFIRNAYLQKRASLIKENTGRVVPGPTGPGSGDPLDELEGTDLNPLDTYEDADIAPNNNATAPAKSAPAGSAIPQQVMPMGTTSHLEPKLSIDQQYQDNLMLALVLTDFNQLEIREVS